MNSRRTRHAWLSGGLLCFAGLSSCGLVKAPFRVAGAVVDGVYVTGKKAVDASSEALEKRKKRKEKEEEEKAKQEAKEQVKPQEPAVLPPPDAVPPAQGPIIPIDPANPPPPVEPEPLPKY